MAQQHIQHNRPKRGYFPHLTFKQLETQAPLIGIIEYSPTPNNNNNNNNKRTYSLISNHNDNIKRPTISFNHVKSTQEFEEWLQWAKNVWTELKTAKKKQNNKLFSAYRLAFTGISDRIGTEKTFEYRSETRNENSVDKMQNLSQEQLMKKAEDKLERKLKSKSQRLIDNSPSIFVHDLDTFDRELPIGTPVFSSEALAERGSSILMMWDFLISYKAAFQRTIHFEWFDISFFEKALLSEDRSSSLLLNEIVCGLLHVLRVQAPKKTEKNALVEENRFEHSIVVSNLTWPFYLKNFVIEYRSAVQKKKKIEVDDDIQSSLPDDDEYNEFLDSLIELNIWDHATILNLPINDLLTLLEFLSYEAMSSYMIRKVMDKRVEKMEEIENSRSRIRQETLRSRTNTIEAAHTCTIAAAVCLNGILNEVCGDDKHYHNQLEEYSLEKMRHQKIDVSLEYMKHEQNLNLDLLDCPIRGISLGQDRCGTHYFIFGNDNNRVFFRQRANWSFYTIEQAMELLLFLSPRIMNEYQLAWNIRKFLIDVRPEGKNLPRNHHKYSEDPYFYFLNDSYFFSPSKRQRPELFDMFNRCIICQDIWDSKKEIHCDKCHSSFGIGDAQHSCDPQESERLLSTDVWLRVAKACLLDLQIAIPTDAYSQKKTLVNELATEWRKKVKNSTDTGDLRDSLSDIENRLDRNFMGKDHNRAVWRNILASCNDTATLSVLVYDLEKGIRYDKTRASQVSRQSSFNTAEIENSESESVDQDISGSVPPSKDGTSHIDNPEASISGVVGCLICGKEEQPEQILLCDSCNQEFHMFCLDPPLMNVPDGEWFCRDCSPTFSISGRKRKLVRRPQDGSPNKSQKKR